MKQILVLTLLLSFFSIAVCQRSHLTISNDFKITEKEYQDQTIANSVYHNNYFYTATNSAIGGGNWLFTKLYDLKYAITVSKYDKNMNKIKEYVIGNGEKEFGPLMPQLILINNKLALAYFKPDENKSSFSFYLALVDDEDLSLKNPQKFCTIQQNNVGLFKIENIINGKLVSFAYSPDKTKTLVICVANASLLQTYVIDNELHILRQSDLHTPTTGFTVSSAALTNDNVECIVMNSQEGAKVVANSADKRKTETKLNSAGGLIPSFTHAAPSKDGQTIYVCASGKDASTSVGNCDGFLLYELDCTTMHLSKPFSYSFTPEQVQTFCENGAGIKHKKKYYMYNFMPGVIELDNRNIVVLGCPQLISTSVHTSARDNMNNNTHEITETSMDVGPIMAFYPDKAGKNFEYAFIPRHIEITNGASSGSGAIQIVQFPGITQSYSGFVAVNLGNEVMIIYNDVPKNVNTSENVKVSKADSPKDLILAEAMFGADEKLQYRKQIGENLTGRNTYFLGNVVPTSSNLIVFPIAKEGRGFNARKTYYTNWCFLEY